MYLNLPSDILGLVMGYLHKKNTPSTSRVLPEWEYLKTKCKIFFGPQKSKVN